MDGQKKPSGSSLDIGVFGPQSRQRVPYGTRDKGPQDTDGPNALSLLRVYLRIFVCKYERCIDADFRPSWA